MLFDRSVSVVVRRMYYWDSNSWTKISSVVSVSVVVRRMYYWDGMILAPCGSRSVSVVVRRMYYWDED